MRSIRCDGVLQTVYEADLHTVVADMKMVQAHQAAWGRSMSKSTILSQEVDLPEPVVLSSMEIGT